MIRPFTCICMLLAGGSGLYLYQAKHTAQLLDREIARTVKQADAARERAGVLSAEYALLNDPERLADLADEHLPSLKKTAPTQFTTWAELAKRLPPVGAPAFQAPPLEPEAPAAKLPELPPEAKPVAAPPQLIATVAPAAAGTAAPAPPVAVAPPVAATAAAREPVPSRPAAPAPAARPVPVLARPAAPAAHPASLIASLQTPSPPAASVHATAAPVRPAATATAASASTAPAAAALRPVSLTASLQPQPAAAPVHTVVASAQPAPPVHAAARSLASTAATPGAAAEPVTRVARSGSGEFTSPAVASSLGMARSMAAPAAVTPVSAPAIWQPGGGQQSVTR